MTTTGVELDSCSSCNSVWFDRGEAFFFVDDVSDFALFVEEARRTDLVTDMCCPHGGEPMVALGAGGEAYLDHDSGGIWFTAEAARSLASNSRRRLEWADPDRSPVTHRKALPSLVLQSFFTITGLYAALTLALIGASLYLGLQPVAALGISAAVLFLQYSLSPLIMDFSLPRLYRVKWINVEDLPTHLQEFLSTACEEEGIVLHRFGLIPDLTPNAFTYGHTPKNARVVITQGILELLEPQEIEAVVGHELGHARNWDMALMTAAHLVPMFFYFLYRFSLEFSKGSRKNRGPSLVVAIGAYATFLASELVVLAFSRTREYHADKTGADLCGSPRALASALVKIAYGLASREEAHYSDVEDKNKHKKKRKNKNKRLPPLSSIGAMGIFSGDNARTLALLGGAGASTGAEEQPLDGGYSINPDTLQGAMKWDLWNPWARFYELQSTHPLVAKRILHLSALSASRDEEPLVHFNLQQPESYWDEFFTDLAIKMGPVLAGLLYTGVGLAMGVPLQVVIGPALAGVGLAMMLKLCFRYPMKAFPEMSVATLLRQVKVSDIRPVPCRLKGRVRGKGIAGLIWSDDFVMQDDTGIIFLDHRQPFALWEMIWAWFRADAMIGKSVEVDGWYHRSPTPYVEVNTFTVNGRKRRSHLRTFTWLVAGAVFALGIAHSIRALS